MNFLELKQQFVRGDITKTDFIRNAYATHKILFEYASLLDHLPISEISVAKDGLTVTIQPYNIRLYCLPGDERLIPFEIINFGSYEASETEFVIQTLKSINPRCMLDIGANYGYYSLLVEKIFPECKVFAFEPIPYSFRVLNRNLHLNNSRNIFAVNKGLSNKSGQSTFYYYPEGSGNASLSNLSNRSDVEKITCQLDTLDEFMKENPCDVDFIKCDVEGAELLVLQGGIETLKKYRPFVFVELLRKWSAKFNYHPNDYLKTMKGLGYECLVLDAGQVLMCDEVTESTVQTNYFFLHQDRHRDLLVRIMQH